MAPTYTNRIDCYFKSGAFLQGRVTRPRTDFIFKLLGRTETNLGGFEGFAIGEPILFLEFSKALLIAVMGENEAQRKWEVQTILMPLSCMTACTLRNFERTINKDLKDNFPGLDSWLDEALKYWDPHYDRAVDEGLITLEEELEWRNEVDDTVKRRIMEYLERAELAKADFASEEYDEDALNTESPVVRGEAHHVTLPRLVEHLKLCSKRLTDVAAQKKVLRTIDQLPKTDAAWREIVEKEAREAVKVSGAKDASQLGASFITLAKAAEASAKAVKAAKAAKASDAEDAAETTTAKPKKKRTSGGQIKKKQTSDDGSNKNKRAALGSKAGEPQPKKRRKTQNVPVAGLSEQAKTENKTLILNDSGIERPSELDELDEDDNLTPLRSLMGNGGVFASGADRTAPASVKGKGKERA